MGSGAKDMVGMVVSLIPRNNVSQMGGGHKLSPSIGAMQCRENTTLGLNLKSGKFPTDSVSQSKVTTNTTAR